MESKPRQMLVAMGLFVGGVALGSTPGFGAHETKSAHAATTEPRPEPTVRPKPNRGGLSPALRATPSDDAREVGGIEPMDWGGRCTLASRPRRESGSEEGPGLGGKRGSMSRMPAASSDDDPLRGLTLPGLPVSRHPRVLKYVRWFTESRDGRKTFLDAFKRSGRFSEIIAKSLRELGLPTELLAVALIESGFSPVAVSTAGAAGLWQFMPQTGRAYGLTVESDYDERASIWRSTDAAARHLADLYEHFRSWELAIAAYNLGYEGLERRLDEFETEDFWELADAPGALPNETAHYVPKVLAAAVVLANLDEFGFGDVERAAAIDASELDVPGGTRLALVARAAGTSVRTLHELNPELLSEVVPDRGATVTLHVPRSGLSRARVMLSKLVADGDDSDERVSSDFDWGKDDVREGRSTLERTAGGRTHARTSALGTTRRRSRKARQAVETTDAKAKNVGDETSEKTEKTEKAPSERAPNERTSNTKTVFYRVAPGDSIKGIATMFGLTVDEVVARAGVASPEQIKAGTLLELRVTSGTIGELRRGTVD